MADREVDWEALLRAVQTDYPSLYRAWFQRLEPGRLCGGAIEVYVDDASRLRYLREHCAQAFADAAVATSGRLLTVRFLPARPLAEEAVPRSDGLTHVALNPDYTFDDFVVGPPNRLAYAACRAVCERPGSLYNPLFLHGGPGLGKTHLLQAACAALRRRLPGCPVVYLPASTLAADVVRAMEEGHLAAVREELRGAAVLVLDDLQLLEGRDTTQEELFHAFNALHQAGRQLVLAADRPPSAMKGLQDRLTSRFQWGLVAQVGPPDREMRHAILSRKARLRGCELPGDILDYLAARGDWDLRALEAILTALATEQRAAPQPLTPTAVDRLLVSHGTAAHATPLGHIVEAVAHHFAVRPDDLLGRRRVRSLAYPRQIAMYLARELTPLSLQEIGAHFGGRDHSTVLHACRVIAAERRYDPQTAQTIDTLTNRLRQPLR